MSTCYEAWVGYGIRLDSLGKYEDLWDVEGLLKPKGLKVVGEDPYYLVVSSTYVDTTDAETFSPVVSYKADELIAEGLRILEARPGLQTHRGETKVFMPSWIVQPYSF